MPATLTLEAFKYSGIDVFENMVIPEDLNRQFLVAEIERECFGLEVLYTNPSFLAAQIGVWSFHRMPIWQKMLTTTEYDYDPIYNYDRKEEREWSENIDKEYQKQGSVQEDESKTNNLTSTVSGSTNLNTSKQSTSQSTGETDDTTNQTETAITQKAAYNSDTFENTDKVETTVEQTHHNDVTGSVTNNETGEQHGTDSKSQTDEATEGRKNTVGSTDTGTESDFHTHKETMRAYGNIGVTTTQQMIQQEREIINYDIYQIIAEEFRSTFCLLVY